MGRRHLAGSQGQTSRCCYPQVIVTSRPFEHCKDIKRSCSAPTWTKRAQFGKLHSLHQRLSEEDPACKKRRSKCTRQRHPPQLGSWWYWGQRPSPLASCWSRSAASNSGWSCPRASTWMDVNQFFSSKKQQHRGGLKLLYGCMMGCMAEEWDVDEQ